MADIDLSTSQLKRMLDWGIEDYQCTKPLVTALIKDLLSERDRAIAAEQRFAKMMSDMEIRNAKKAGQQPNKPRYQDGVRYQNPNSRPLGPDGFPQRGIV